MRHRSPLPLELTIILLLINERDNFYASLQDAERAIQQLDSSSMAGRSISVQYADKRAPESERKKDGKDGKAGKQTTKEDKEPALSDDERDGSDSASEAERADSGDDASDAESAGTAQDAPTDAKHKPKSQRSSPKDESGRTLVVTGWADKAGGVQDACNT